VFPFRLPPSTAGAPASQLDELKAQLRLSFGFGEKQNLDKFLYEKDGEVWSSFSLAFERIIMGKDDYTEDEMKAYSTDLKVGPDTPPAFIWSTRSDKTVPVADSMDFAMAMIRNGRPCELHIYAIGDHGLSLATEETAGKPAMVNERVQTWFPLALSWLKQTL
jgi:acetyl esterase/lipase